jgi:hypothetical protein
VNGEEIAKISKYLFSKTLKGDAMGSLASPIFVLSQVSLSLSLFFSLFQSSFYSLFFPPCPLIPLGRLTIFTAKSVKGQQTSCYFSVAKNAKKEATGKSRDLLVLGRKRDL